MEGCVCGGCVELLWNMCVCVKGYMYGWCVCGGVCVMCAWRMCVCVCNEGEVCLHVCTQKQ